MIDISAEDFKNLPLWQKAHYRAASNFINEAEIVTSTTEKIKLLREAVGHFRIAGDTVRAELLEKDIVDKQQDAATEAVSVEPSNIANISAEEFSNLPPWQRADYRAASKLCRKAKKIANETEKNKLLVEAVAYFRDAGDTERATFVERSITESGEAAQ